MENGWVNPWWWIISGCVVRHAFVWFAFQSEIEVNEILRKMRRSSLGWGWQRENGKGDRE